jgi:hypothetical protein
MKKIVFKVAILSFFSAFSLNAQTRIWNINSLQNAKSLTSEAAKIIIRDANKEISKTLVTVMDKPMTPASGDKHDYMSAGKYWWPDPKNPTGAYIRKDGVVNSEVAKFDRTSLGTMAKGVTCLSVAYYLTSEDRFAEKAVENLRIWFQNPQTRMNPNMNFGQTIPGRNDGKGRGEGIIDTYSFIEMLDGIELVKKSPSFTTDDHQGMIKWFSAYLDWMMTSEIGNEEYSAKNNHGTAFDVQATRYALFVGKEAIARKYINDFAARRLFSQIEPDGSQPFELARTTALGYSVFNLTHFLDMCFMAKTLNTDLFNVKSYDGRSIPIAIDFLTQFIGKPMSQFPYKQIKDWEGVQKKLCWQLYRADKFLTKPVYKKYYKNKISDSDKEDTLLFN